jgi:hypothetical protein
MDKMGEKLAPDFDSSLAALLLLPFGADLWKGTLISCFGSESRTAASAAKGHVNPCGGAILYDYWFAVCCCYFSRMGSVSQCVCVCVCVRDVRSVKCMWMHTCGVWMPCRCELQLVKVECITRMQYTCMHICMCILGAPALRHTLSMHTRMNAWNEIKRMYLCVHV